MTTERITYTREHAAAFELGRLQGMEEARTARVRRKRRSLHSAERPGFCCPTCGNMEPGAA